LNILEVNYTKYINLSLIGFAFSLPISKAGTTAFSVTMILFWLLSRDFVSKFNELKRSKFILLLVSLILFSFLSILWSPDKLFAFQFMQKYWHFLIIPVIYTSLNKKYVNSVILAFLSGMFISEIVLYGIFFELIHYKNLSPSTPVPFMDWMNYSTYLSLASLILLNKIFFTETLKWRTFYILYFLVTTSSLFINNGKTGQVIFIIMIFVTILINVQKKIRALFLTLLLTFGILAIAYTTSPNFNNGANIVIADITNIIHNTYVGSFGQRVALWTIGANIFTNNIFVGTGIGGEVENFDYYANALNFTHYISMKIETGFLDFHNSFIQYAVQLGLVGLFIFLAIFYSLATLNFKTKEYHNLNILFISIFLLQSMTLFTFHLNHPMVLFALFAGLLISISKLENQT